MTKKILLVALVAVVTVTALIADYRPFVEDYFYPKSIIAAFSAESVGNKFGILDYAIDNGIVKTNIDSFNSLAESYKIVDLVQMHDFVTHLDWNDNGVYLQNIYRIVLNENDNIEKALTAISKEDYILYAEYETINRFRYTPNDPDYSQQWHHPVMKMPEVWEHVKGSREVVISITDSGAKWNHPDLADNIWINEAELPGITINWAAGQILGGDGIDNSGSGRVDDIIGWDFIDNNNNPYQYSPGSGHGTHVAGCAGAVGDNGIGVTGTAMVVSLMTCKGSPTGTPSGGVQFGYQQIQYSAQAGAHIINASWGGPGDGNYANSVVNYATNLGALVIAAAGNENTEHTSTYRDFPADAINAFCVAATGPNDVKANFSDYGHPIDISAPGVNILATNVNNGYVSWSGTSMAAPLVAGIAALVKTLHPELAPLQIKERIMMTADFIDDKNHENYAGLLGAGRVNAYRAVMHDLLPDLSIFDYSLEEYSGDGDGVPNPGEEAAFFVHLFNEIDWKTASNVEAVITTNAPGVEITHDRVTYSNIGGGSVVFSQTPFRFITEETLSDLSIDFQLTITANDNERFPYEEIFNLSANLSMQQAGWPFALGGSSSSSAIIADINANGMNEVVFGDSQGNLHVVRSDKSPLPGFPVNLGANISTATAATDLTGNGRKEIIATTQTGVINCVNHRGEILFTYNTGGQIRSNPMIIDVNNNGSFEIVQLTFSNPKLIILNADGSDFPGFPIDISGSVLSPPASADLTGDGNKEIIFTTNNGTLHAISAVTGQDVAGWPQSAGSASWNGPIVGDLSGDNLPEIVVANVQGLLNAFDRTGSLLFSRQFDNAIRSGILVNDLNDDGNSEIVLIDMRGNLFVTDNNGNDYANFPVNLGNSTDSSPILADMTGDGNLEIIFGDSAGLLHSVNLAGNQTANFPIVLGGSISVGPAIGYINGNDTPGILVPNQSGYNFIDFKRSIGDIAWGMFRGNDRRSGNFADLTPVDNIIEELPYTTKLHANYPNPFNPETSISFTMADEGLIRLDIYNVRGQLVKTLINDTVVAGEHRVVWNGIDDNGRTVSSGIYFYSLQTENYRATQKMMLLK